MSAEYQVIGCPWNDWGLETVTSSWLTNRLRAGAGGPGLQRCPATHICPMTSNKPVPLPGMPSSCLKMKGKWREQKSKAPENFWNVLNPFRIPVKTATNPWKMHQGHVTTPPVSLMSHSQMDVSKLQRLAGAHLFINTVSLFMSLSPCLIPDEGNKASI